MNKILLGLIGVVFTLGASEIYATFNVEAKESASLAFDASGVIKTLKTDISATVKKGTILATLDNSDKKANLEVAKTALKFAKKDYERQLKVKNLIDESKFDSYAFKYENAKNRLAYQEAIYEKTFLKAPFDGVIFFKDVEVGDTVSGMMLKTVLKIQSKKERKLILSFDQKYHKVVEVGAKFKYGVDGDSKVYEGTISKIYPIANSANRKIEAEVKAKNFIVGLFGEGYILVPDSK